MTAMKGYGSASIGGAGMSFEVGEPRGDVVTLYGYIGTFPALVMMLSPDVARKIAADLAGTAAVIETLSAPPDPAAASLPAAGGAFFNEVTP